MRCRNCEAHKLYREFPHKALTGNCDHAPLHCLRCTKESVEKNQCCSVCKEPVATDNPRYQECVYILKRMFPDVETPQAIPCTTKDETIKVSLIDGEEVTIEFDPNMTVFQIKKKIQELLNIKPEQQRLLYQEKQLVERYDCATLLECNVQSSSTINLVVVLYKIPDSFDKVTFDLSWEFPTVDSVPMKEYLDASILLYSGNTFQEVLDWKHKQSESHKAVLHSGDKDDNTNLTGHQTIEVKIKSLPQQIDKMFFTLSAFGSEKISKYPNPRLLFFHARDPNNKLCDDSLTRAVSDCQAVIMCSMCKTKEGKWQVLSLKHMCDGNAQNYTPIQNTIQELIKNGIS